jgi:2-amino-4-hydroxy-6-hydroxymethyldihydropteridine diphosphokinase
MLSIIALGSNIGDRQINIKEGIKALEALGLVTVSPCWLETPDETAIGPHYLNTAVILHTAIALPQTLLESLLRIELQLGRDRSKGKNAPRTLDLDLIAVDDIKGYWQWPAPSDLSILGSELTLELPHPKAHQRLFVMKPIQALNIDIF